MHLGSMDHMMPAILPCRNRKDAAGSRYAKQGRAGMGVQDLLLSAATISEYAAARLRDTGKGPFGASTLFLPYLPLEAMSGGKLGRSQNAHAQTGHHITNRIFL
ncbi:hypothetical protein FB639_003216 [Coemansia asiatica]|nr:hypothetical protein FB639_003216 [Coemansia asiatica]